MDPFSQQRKLTVPKLMLMVPIMAKSVQADGGASTGESNACMV
jgi:hypothetical protein